MNKQAGQALSEYTLIGLLVAVLTIPALTLFGNTLRDRFGNMLTYTSPFSTGAVQELPSTGGIASQTDTGSLGATLRLANGKLIRLPDYPQNVSNFVRTTGANGATGLLADNLTDTAQQMLSSGEIDQEQYNSLVALANQGHEIAGMEKAIEDAIASLPPGQKFSFDMAVTWKGQQVTSGELYNQLGFFNVSKDYLQTTGYLNETTNAGSSIQQLQTLYKASLTNGALADPAVQALVTNLSTDIAVLSRDFIDALNELDTGALASSDLKDSLASRTTNRDSAGICQAGSAKDNGDHCFN